VHILRKTPFLELLTSIAIVGFHAVIAKPRIASDALFIEGVVFSVIGTIIALRISDQVTFPSLHKKQHATRHQQAQSRSGLLTSILIRRNGLRILLIGLILITAAIVIGELLVRSAT
jgi:hypothetical protein